jgi:hypothetical protein
MMRLAMPASRSLIALLVGTVAFFAVWTLALKGGSSNSSSGGPNSGLGAYQSAINKAHRAVTTSNANDAASAAVAAGSGSRTAATSGTSGGASTASGTSGSSKTSTHSPTPKATAAHSAAAAVRLSTVKSAVSAHKVVAILFYNPVAADDQAVKRELAAVPGHRGKVVKLEIPLSEAANFTAVTQQVPVNFSPTLVLIAPGGQAGEIVGFSDSFEIAERVSQALAAK